MSARIFFFQYNIVHTMGKATAATVMHPLLRCQLPHLGLPETATSVVWLNQIQPPLPWWGYKLPNPSSKEISAYAQPLLVKHLNFSSQFIHALMGIQIHDPLNYQRKMAKILACTITATWTIALK